MCDELTGHPIAHDQVVEGIRTEMVQLETLGVGDTYPEKKGRTIAVEHEVQILTARWVFTQKTCLLYTSPSPRDGLLSRMPSSA